jgi:hypothetical protein
MGVGCYATSQRGWVRRRWGLSRLLGNKNAGCKLFLRSGDTSALPFPFLSDSLGSTCGPYIFVCLVTTCLYTTLGMVSLNQLENMVQIVSADVTCTHDTQEAFAAEIGAMIGEPCRRCGCRLNYQAGEYHMCHWCLPYPATFSPLSDEQQARLRAMVKGKRKS